MGLTRPPSSCRWRSPLHRVVCYLESPRDKKQWHFRFNWPLTFLSCNPLCSHLLPIFPLALSPHTLHPLPPPLTRLSLCSLLVQASMKVWAMTEREASTTSDTWTSKVKWGFLRMFTQNLRGRLQWRKRVHQSRLLSLLLLQNGGKSHQAHYIYEFVWVGEAFHVWEHLPEVQLSAVQDNNRDGEKPFLVGDSLFRTIPSIVSLYYYFICYWPLWKIIAVKWKRMKKKKKPSRFFSFCAEQQSMMLIFSNEQWLEVLK